MNTRKTTRRDIWTGLGPKNKFTQNGFPKRIYNTCKNRPKRRYFPKFRKNRLQSVQNVLGYNSNYRSQRPNINFNRFSSTLKQNNKPFINSNTNNNDN